MKYGEDRRWSDRYIPAIKQIVGPYLLAEAPDIVDRRQASDLIVVKAKNMTVACRVRRPGFAERYPYQFTIRLSRDSGRETEFVKIARGWADWMFYGHAAQGDGVGIDHWHLIDLDSFRCHLICEHTRETIRKKKGVSFGKESNGDGRRFLWFDLRHFAPEPKILIASSGEIPKMGG